MTYESGTKPKVKRKLNESIDYVYTIREHSDNLIVKCLCEKTESLLMDIRDDVEKL
jgi:hypothetical protein